MSTNDLTTRTWDDIEVAALSAHEWRVCDSRIDGNDAFSLVGFIEKNRDLYEMMEFGDPVECLFFTSLELAVSHFVTAPPAPIEIGSERGFRAS